MVGAQGIEPWTSPVWRGAGAPSRQPSARAARFWPARLHVRHHYRSDGRSLPMRLRCRISPTLPSMSDDDQSYRLADMQPVSCPVIREPKLLPPALAGNSSAQQPNRERWTGTCARL